MNGTAAYLKVAKASVVVMNEEGHEIGSLSLQEFCQVVSLVSRIPIIAGIKVDDRVQRIANQIKATMTPGVS